MFDRFGRACWCLLGVLGVMALLAPGARAGTVNIPADPDCYYDERHDDTECGEDLLVGLQGHENIWRWTSTLVFDVAGSLPNGAEIVSATLYAYASYATDPFTTGGIGAE